MEDGFDSEKLSMISYGNFGNFAYDREVSGINFIWVIFMRHKPVKTAVKVLYAKGE